MNGPVVVALMLTVVAVLVYIRRDRHRTDKTLPIDRAQSRSQLMPPTPYDDYLPLVYPGQLVYPKHVRAEFRRINAEVLAEIDLALYQVDYDPNEEKR